jgi:hypothetical protein
MVGIEIGVLRGQCRHRRIGERERLVAQIAAWEKQRNETKPRINGCSPWNAPAPNCARAYPVPGKAS